MRKSLMLLCLIFIFVSCNSGKNGIDVEIINSSDETVSSVIFYTFGSELVFDKIKSNQKVAGFLDMTNTKGDGSYTLTFIDENKEKKQIAGGYYTNGGSLERKVIYEIKNDTVLVEFKDF